MKPKVTKHHGRSVRKPERLGATVSAILCAARDGGWQLSDRDNASTGTIYLHLWHPVKSPVTIRVSDHGGSDRGVDKRIHVTVTNQTSIDNSIRFLHKGARWKQVIREERRR